MISKQEAQIIAHEHIEGVILHEDCRTKMGYRSAYPIAWVFRIYHRNQDKDTFQTVIEITRNGVVSLWDRIHIGDENDL